MFFCTTCCICFYVILSNALLSPSTVKRAFSDSLKLFFLQYTLYFALVLSLSMRNHRSSAFLSALPFFVILQRILFSVLLITLYLLFLLPFLLSKHCLKCRISVYHCFSRCHIAARFLFLHSFFHFVVGRLNQRLFWEM